MHLNASHSATLSESLRAVQEPLLLTRYSGHIHSDAQHHVGHSREHGTVAAERPAGGRKAGIRGIMPLFGSCCCGGGRSGKPKRERRRRKHRRHHGAAPPSRTSMQRPDVPATPGAVLPPLAVGSVASDTEYHDAREAWSVTDGDHSPLSSAQVSPRAVSLIDHAHADEAYEEFASDSGSSSSESGSSTSQQSTGFGAKLVGCLSIMRASSAGDEELHRGTPRAGHHHHHHAPGFKPPVACTFHRRSPGESPDSATLCWDECESSNFQIRSRDYMQTRVKESSSKAIYRLIAMDLFSTDTKAFHVAKMFGLPATGPPVVCKAGVGGGPDVVLPQLLIMNVQLPDYPAPFWGTNDGPGQSIVYFFQLREDFDPEKFENTAALGLLQRFVSNGRETDGSPTRDRLKLIVRVANLEEWAKVAPLSATEYKLLQNYNEKPVLTRPQQVFHVGPNYLEVDLDVHNYAFLARKALWSYHNRLATVVWDMGFVIQGNCPEELPEQLLGCGRIYRSDFRQFKPLPEVVSALSSCSLTPSIASISISSRPPSTATDRLLSPSTSANASNASASAAVAGTAVPAAAAAGTASGEAMSKAAADGATAAAVAASGNKASSNGESSAASGDAAILVSGDLSSAAVDEGTADGPQHSPGSKKAGLPDDAAAAQAKAAPAAEKGATAAAGAASSAKKG